MSLKMEAPSLSCPDTLVMSGQQVLRGISVVRGREELQSEMKGFQVSSLGTLAVRPSARSLNSCAAQSPRRSDRELSLSLRFPWGRAAELRCSQSGTDDDQPPPSHSQLLFLKENAL